MKKLFITGALLLSVFSLTSMQEKTVMAEKAEGSYVEPSRICRYYAIGEALQDDNDGYGTSSWQYDYLGYYNDCMSMFN